MVLHSIGMSYEHFHNLSKSSTKGIAISKMLLRNTYVKNIYSNCGLLFEEGTAKFLCRQSLSSNTTDDHYTSFTDKIASIHLHDYMSFVIPQIELNSNDCANPTVLPNGNELHTFTPHTTRHRAGLIGSFKLKPGDEILIKCPHGVTGTAKALKYKETDFSCQKNKKED